MLRQILYYLPLTQIGLLHARYAERRPFFMNWIGELYKNSENVHTSCSATETPVFQMPGEKEIRSDETPAAGVPEFSRRKN